MSEEHFNYKTPGKGIHAFIDPSATLGDDTVVWHYARVLARVRIGDGCSIGGGAEIGIGSEIGDGSRISANVFLPASSLIGQNVFIGPGAVFTDDLFPRVLRPGETYNAEPPVIDDGASIGAGAVVLPGIHIGKCARVAAGAVVTHDVPPFTAVRGLPARVMDLEADHPWIAPALLEDVELHG